MNATIIQVADAVVDTLNGASLSLPFTAVRTYVPVHALPDLASLTVSVVPGTLVGTLINRQGGNIFTYVIDVGIQKRIPVGLLSNDDVLAACDPIARLAEEIDDLFDGLPLVGVPFAACVDVRTFPLFVPAHLDEQRVFTCIISITFKLVR